uniref:Kelch-like protein diablo n=1 Tax=Glossina brevipalpis TaxID=37001 RepID=A0A1A9VZI0_9MUSC
MNEDRCYHSATALNGVVYLMGGYNDNNDSRLRTTECYNPVNKRWNRIAPMNNLRYNFGICSYNDFVYAVGGYDTSTVECYNPATDKWGSCPNIPNGSSYYTRATLLGNSIYSLVRYGHNSAPCLRFDPREQRWYEMNMTRDTPDGFELVSYDRTLFYINDDSCKRLDVRVNTWESMPSMHIKRKYFSAVIAADNIYVLGGLRDGKYVKSVERYNISNNEWTIIDSIEIEHLYGGTAVVDGDFKF